MRFFIFFIVSIIFISCKYQLTETAKLWNPYKTGDVLIFESNDKQLDTFFIAEIEQSFTGENEILNVNYQYLSKDSSSQIKADTVHTFFIALTAWQRGKTVFSLNLYTPKAKFSPFVAKRITWLDSLPLTRISNYTKVLTLVPDNYRNVNDDQNDSTLVRKVYWSKTEGLIGYALKNKKRVWLLKKKYSL